MFATERAELAMAINAIDHLPERIQPPVVLITPGSPYIEPDTYCDYIMNIEVSVITARATNENMSDSLDDMIEDVLNSLGDWTLVEVQQPFTLEYHGTQFLATKINIRKEV